ncbi:MAG: isoprenyl transferase [Lachnoclostridium sp.]|jgi:undecaprenyl diphosphate synthase|nr:isoprenyl transferase [Lachnoclostridium sp.]
MDTSNLKIPKHVAIILDGNGRWAKKKHLPRNVGHVQGSKTVEKMCEECDKVGIKYFTVYAFSTENWGRPEKEVNALMDLLRRYLKDCVKRSMKNNMRVSVIGDITPLSEDLKESIREVQEVSKHNTGLHFQVALNYGSRDEMIRGMKRLMNEILDERMTIDDLNEEKFSEFLDTKDLPEPDLLIRTSGEQRLSNFLLWQLAYTEFYFTDVLWPDFNKKELWKAIEYYNSRERRYGKV